MSLVQETNLKDILVIYHANCADGFSGAWVIWKAFGERADYYPGVYLSLIARWSYLADGAIKKKPGEPGLLG